MAIPHSISIAIRHEMSRARLTAQLLAASSGLTQQTVDTILAGQRNPSVLELTSICKALQLNPLDLFYDHADPNLANKNSDVDIILRLITLYVHSGPEQRSRFVACLERLEDQVRSIS